MSSVLPVFFVGLSGLFLVLVLHALWQSLRSLFSAGEGVMAAASSLPQRQALLEEKRSLLTTIKDLSNERDVGKLSEQDFKALDVRYRSRARQVLKDLDAQVEPFRGEARGLIREHMLASKLEVPEVLAAAAAPASPAQAPQTPPAGTAAGETQTPAGAGRPACQACGVENEPDAVFCKKCGERFEELTP